MPDRFELTRICIDCSGWVDRFLDFLVQAVQDAKNPPGRQAQARRSNLVAISAKHNACDAAIRLHLSPPPESRIEASRGGRRQPSALRVRSLRREESARAQLHVGRLDATQEPSAPAADPLPRPQTTSRPRWPAPTRSTKRLRRPHFARMSGRTRTPFELRTSSARAVVGPLAPSTMMHARTRAALASLITPSTAAGTSRSTSKRRSSPASGFVGAGELHDAASRCEVVLQHRKIDALCGMDGAVHVANADYADTRVIEESCGN